MITGFEDLIYREPIRYRVPISPTSKQKEVWFIWPLLSKAVLSRRLSNTMDSELVMDVLDEALSLYGRPEIFNTN
jgi:hypothetical protein